MLSTADQFNCTKLFLLTLLLLVTVGNIYTGNDTKFYLNTSPGNNLDSRYCPNEMIWFERTARTDKTRILILRNSPRSLALEPRILLH